MQKLLIAAILAFAVVPIKVKAAALQPDTIMMFPDDTLPVALDDTSMIELNFDANLDSMLNLYYVEQSVTRDPEFWNADTDSLIPDFPDSVFIERLKKIPTVVDLTYNSVVRRYIEVYTRQRRSSVEVMLGLSQYYFPLFDEIFDYYDIPNEIKYMSIIESALNPRAYSRTRAVGLWQFMYGTGRLYGLTINSLIDERRDPIKSTHAAARFVKDLYAIYNDWILVIAAYNCGPTNVNKAIRRSGGKRNYWDIYYYLPRETRGHVPAFIAATYVMNYYKEHNLKPVPVEFPVASDTIMVTQELHLAQVADNLGIPVQLLRDMNPQYRTDIIPAKDKPLVLILPLDQAPRFIDMEQQIYSYKDSVYFNPDKIITSPTSYDSRNYDAPPPANYTKLIYHVKEGDNLGFISMWYHVRISDIRYWNNIRYNTIRTGQRLTIYVPKEKAGKYQDIDDLSFAEKQARIGKSTTVAVVAQKAPPTLPDLSSNVEYVIYTVKQGDTIWDIARKYPGVSETDIMRLNNISDASKIRAGQQLKIKPKT
jgi:membrane-bound lytic murein transglycosylase D